MALQQFQWINRHSAFASRADATAYDDDDEGDEKGGEEEEGEGETAR